MKIGIYDSKNTINEVDVDLNLFRSASEEGFKHGLAKLNSMVPTGDNQATAAQQVYARLGVGSTNLANVMSGQFVAGAVTEDGSITGRLAIQAYLMDAMET